MDYKKSLYQLFPVFMLVWSSYYFSQANKPTTQEIDRQISLTNQLYLQGKTDNFLANSKKIISPSTQLKYNKGMSYGYYFLAAYYYDNAEFRESIHHAKKAQEYKDYLSHDLTHSARISTLLGGNYLLLELYTLSSKNYNKALATLASKSKKNTTDSLTESTAYSNLS